VTTETTETSGGRRPRRNFTADELKAIYDAWVEGKRLVDLGQEYDVSLNTIWRAVNKHEATLPPEKCITRDEMIARRIKMDRERRLAAVRDFNSRENPVRTIAVDE
jgi:hypothetical protein